MVDLAWPMRFRRRRRESATPLNALAGYSRENVFQRNRKKLAVLLFFVMLFYMLVFNLLGRFIAVYLLAPLGIPLLLIIWALPDTGRAPVRLLKGLFFAFLGALMFWPDYLAFELPGMPWITMLRLVGLPMVLVLLISLSVSKDFRGEMKEILGSQPAIFKMMVTFTLLAILSLAFTKNMPHSFNKLVIALVNWSAIFFVSCYVFSKPGNVRRFAVLLWVAVVFWAAMGFWEWRISHVPWANSIPSFLKIEDDSVQRILAGAARSATGMYRVAAKFSTSLNFSEFLALATPFVLHFSLVARRWQLRVAAMVTLPVIFWTIIRTDSRLGMVGFLMTFMIYALFWAASRWRQDRESIFGPAITLAYPVIFAVFLAATFLVGRLRIMVWGSGQHQASNNARFAQLDGTIPHVLHQPWGYGIGMGGQTLGFVSPSGVLTIDSYYLTAILDYGVLGFIVYFGMFFTGIFKGLRKAIEVPEDETLWIAPASTALAVFVIVKAVLSGIENHPLAFALLGMVVALLWRTERQPESATPAMKLPVSALDDPLVTARARHISP